MLLRRIGETLDRRRPNGPRSGLHGCLFWSVISTLMLWGLIAVFAVMLGQLMGCAAPCSRLSGSNCDDRSENGEGLRLLLHAELDWNRNEAERRFSLPDHVSPYPRPGVTSTRTK